MEFPFQFRVTELRLLRIREILADAFPVPLDAANPPTGVETLGFSQSSLWDEEGLSGIGVPALRSRVLVIARIWISALRPARLCPLRQLHRHCRGVST
jgi:hypothetical protein